MLCTFCGYNPPEDPHYCGNYLGLNNESRCCFCTHNISRANSCIVIINEQFPPQYECNCDDIEENDDLPGSPCLNHTLTITLGDNINSSYCHFLSKDDSTLILFSLLPCSAGFIYFDMGIGFGVKLSQKFFIPTKC